MRTLFISLILTFASSAIAAPIATVGNETIDTTSLSYRLLTEKAYGNSIITETDALISLINDAIELNTANSLGVGPTESEILNLANHALQTTKAPAVLAKINALFGNDINAYNKLYISPKVANKKLREHHSNTAEIHIAEKTIADSILSLASSGKPFQEIADETIAAVSSFDVPIDSSAALATILSGLTAGEVHPTVIDEDSSFVIVKLTEKDTDKYTVEALRIQKKSFDDWFRGVAQEIVIQIQDPQLIQSIQNDYPSIWWASNL